MSNKRFADEPAKGPPLGSFDVEKADALTKPKTPFTATMTPDLKLYTKPPSVKPELDYTPPPFGSDAKGPISFGRQTCYPCMDTKYNRKAHKAPGVWVQSDGTAQKAPVQKRKLPEIQMKFVGKQAVVDKNAYPKPHEWPDMEQVARAIYPKPKAANFGALRLSLTIRAELLCPPRRAPPLLYFENHKEHVSRRKNSNVGPAEQRR